MSEDLKRLYLSQQPILKALPTTVLETVLPFVRIRQYVKGELIDYGAMHTTRLHFLVKGKVKITEQRECEEEWIKDILTEPDLFGDLGLEGTHNQLESAISLTSHTVLVSFLVTDFRNLLQRFPDLALRYAQTVHQKFQKLQTRHADLVGLDTRQRLMRFIQRWASSDGNKQGDRVILKNYLTHSDIAGFIATSRQSVNSLLNELKTEGLLQYTRQQIELKNPTAWN